MKVADVMQKKVDYVHVNTKVKETARLIFGSRINGVPVLKGKIVVGFITERDILAKFYPTMQEYVDDPIHARDFEGMEKKVNEIFRLPSEKIMSKNPTTIKGDAPLLKAYSLMTARKIGRLPVVDDEGKLIGIISKGDIFNSLVGRQIPLGEEEEFYDWATRHYDIYNDWEQRLNDEIPPLLDLFKNEKVEKVLDVASSTGEHSIALAKHGYTVYGVEASGLMHNTSEAKKSQLSNTVKNKIHFLKGTYKEAVSELPKDLDCAIFMGNAISHVLHTEKNILQKVAKILRSDNAVIVLQLANIKMKFDKNSGFKEFVIREGKYGYVDRHAFLSYYSKGKKGEYESNLAVLDDSGGKWMLQGINGTPIEYVSPKDLAKMLKDLGFSRVDIYGSQFHGDHIFSVPFDENVHDWANIVARR